MSAPLVKEAWKRIERWCQTNDPEALSRLGRGASKKQTDSLEAVIQQPLPDELRTSLSIHNGQSSADSSDFFFGDLRLNSCKEIAENYSGWSRNRRNEPADERFYRFFPTNAIRHHQFNDGWIPVVREVMAGNYLAVDLAPGPDGTVGQVIDFGRDISQPAVLTQSWGEFLSSYADLLDILAEMTDDPDNLYEAFEQIFPRTFLGGMTNWAKEGRWPIVQFSPTWRTETVMSLTKTIRKTKDFSVLPILADALEEAGCDISAVLNHCRDAECKHAKGCWVIDTLVSGKFSTARLCYSA